MNLTIFKYLIFIAHILLIILSFLGPIIYKEFLIVQLFIIISWKINHNNCFLTQIEFFLFDETIIDKFNTALFNDKPKKIKFRVPKIHRYLLYLIFYVFLVYYLINYIILYRSNNFSVIQDF